jgi:hypothetical protein
VDEQLHAYPTVHIELCRPASGGRVSIVIAQPRKLHDWSTVAAADPVVDVGLEGADDEVARIVGPQFEVSGPEEI